MKKTNITVAAVVISLLLFATGCSAAADERGANNAAGSTDSNTVIYETEIPVIAMEEEGGPEALGNEIAEPEIAENSETEDFGPDSSGNENTESKTPGDETAIQEKSETGNSESADFFQKEIDDELFARIYGKSFKTDCTVPREDLRYLHLLHKNLAGETCEGEMIVNVHIADEVLGIFKELYDISYPIEKIRLIDEYDADDELSMEDNNTSSFNFRVVSASGHLSKHGLGMAIDLNPLYNPYITQTSSGTKVEPLNAQAYADRSGDFDYKIDKNDEAYRIFTEHGFFWGGAWKNTKDYQHFEVTTEEIRKYYPWY